MQFLFGGFDDEPAAGDGGGSAVASARDLGRIASMDIFRAGFLTRHVNSGSSSSSDAAALVHYFVLDADALRFYRSMGAAADAALPLGAIAIGAASTVDQCHGAAPGGGRGDATFSLDRASAAANAAATALDADLLDGGLDDRTEEPSAILLSAASAADARGWVRAIQRVIDDARIDDARRRADGDGATTTLRAVEAPASAAITAELGVRHARHVSAGARSVSAAEMHHAEVLPNS